MNELKQIALELLEKYRQAKTSLIWEHSGVYGSTEALDGECEKYRKRIEECM